MHFRPLSRCVMLSSRVYYIALLRLPPVKCIVRASDVTSTTGAILCVSILHPLPPSSYLACSPSPGGVFIAFNASLLTREAAAAAALWLQHSQSLCFGTLNCYLNESRSAVCLCLTKHRLLLCEARRDSHGCAQTLCQQCRHAT